MVKFKPFTGGSQVCRVRSEQIDPASNQKKEIKNPGQLAGISMFSQLQL